MKTFRSVFTFIILAFSMLLPLNVSAGGDTARGEKVLGLRGGYASYNNSGYADVFFQYTFARHVRLDAGLGCIFRHKDKSALDISLDMHFPFRLSRGFQIYPLVGFTYNNWNYAGDGNKSRFGADFGVGFDLYLTQNLKLNLQGKYSLMNGTSGTLCGLGIAYLF